MYIKYNLSTQETYPVNTLLSNYLTIGKFKGLVK